MGSAWPDLGLFATGFLSWTVSTLAAGGGSLLFVAMVSALLGGHAIAPVVTVASAFAAPARVALFHRNIDWRVVGWYVPGATAGAVVGGWVLAQVSGDLVQALVGVFLLGAAVQWRAMAAGGPPRIAPWWFIPVSFASGAISAIVGASGLIANPFYLGYGLEKERMLATRAVNSITIQVVKLMAYARFGLLDMHSLEHGLAAGIGAAAAIWITRPWLHRLDPHLFRQLAVAAIAMAGAAALWKQRGWLLQVLVGGV